MNGWHCGECLGLWLLKWLLNLGFGGWCLMREGGSAVTRLLARTHAYMHASLAPFILERGTRPVCRLESRRARRGTPASSLNSIACFGVNLSGGVKRTG